MDSNSKTINQRDLASGVSQPSLTDVDIGDILARLRKLDFDAMSTKDMNMHAQVMSALLVKISKRHDGLVKLRDEVDARTRAVKAAQDALDLSRTLSQLHGELGVKRWPLFRLFRLRKRS